MKASTEVFMRNQMSNATRRERISYIQGAIDGIAKWNKSTNDEKDEILKEYKREIDRLNKQLGY